MSAAWTGMRAVDFQIVFEPKMGDRFEGHRAAEVWCAARGISVGRLQGSEPRGLLFGSYDIQKWRNLNRKQRSELHGTIITPEDGAALIKLYVIPDDFGAIPPAPPVSAGRDLTASRPKEPPGAVSVTADRLLELRQWALLRAIDAVKHVEHGFLHDPRAGADKLLSYLLKGEVEP